MSLLDDNNQDPVIIDEDKDYLAELTAPGAKFDKSKYPSELDAYKAIAKGKFHADMTVDHRTRELAEIRKDYFKEREENVTRTRLEELIDQLSNKQITPDPTQLGEPQKPVIDTNEIKSLVSSSILEYESTKKQEENYKIVQNKLKERYGPNYQTILSKQLDELDLTAQEVDALARRNPKMFIKTFGLDLQPQADNFQAPPRTSQRSDSFAPTGPQRRTWNFYQKMKQTSPSVYWEPKTQVQMQQDHINLGSDFEDGDFKAY